MKTSPTQLLANLPGPVTAKWPTGERFVKGLAHGTMSVELYALRDIDPQTPHRFENFSDDFTIWGVFWGPDGGEQ